jgi:hypothetical protein
VCKCNCFDVIVQGLRLRWWFKTCGCRSGTLIAGTAGNDPTTRWWPLSSGIVCMNTLRRCPFRIRARALFVEESQSPSQTPSLVASGVCMYVWWCKRCPSPLGPPRPFPVRLESLLFAHFSPFATSSNTFIVLTLHLLPRIDPRIFASISPTRHHQTETDLPSTEVSRLCKRVLSEPILSAN